jgi:hypothetical protein
MMDLGGWLRSVLFEGYAAAFSDDEMNGVLPSLTTEALSDVACRPR